MTAEYDEIAKNVTNWQLLDEKKSEFVLKQAETLHDDILSTREAVVKSITLLLGIIYGVMLAGIGYIVNTLSGLDSLSTINACQKLWAIPAVGYGCYVCYVEIERYLARGLLFVERSYKGAEPRILLTDEQLDQDYQSLLASHCMHLQCGINDCHEELLRLGRTVIQTRKTMAHLPVRMLFITAVTILVFSLFPHR